MSETRNVIIIGSGPAGYTAAVYAARASLQPLMFEGSVTAGGALMNTTEVENFPGFPAGIQGPDLMDAMREQAEKFGAKVVWDDAEQVELTGDVKTVVTGGGDTYRARSVILATGSAYRELGLPDEKRLSGRGVSWCATCDGFFFRDQDIAVVGESTLMYPSASSSTCPATSSVRGTCPIATKIPVAACSRVSPVRVSLNVTPLTLPSP